MNGQASFSPGALELFLLIESLLSPMTLATAYAADVTVTTVNSSLILSLETS